MVILRWCVVIVHRVRPVLMSSSGFLPLMALSSGREPTLLSLVGELLPCKIVLKGYASRVIVRRDEEWTPNRPVHQNVREQKRWIRERRGHRPLEREKKTNVFIIDLRDMWDHGDDYVRSVTLILPKRENND